MSESLEELRVWFGEMLQLGPDMTWLQIGAAAGGVFLLGWMLMHLFFD